jgi:hypothetical protein
VVMASWRAVLGIICGMWMLCAVFVARVMWW